MQDAATSSAELDRETNRAQTESLVGELEAAGMEINYPDLTAFAEATSSVLTDNAETYGELMDQLNEWLASK